MKIHEALRTQLANNSGVAAIAGARIYAGLPPQIKATDQMQPTVVLRLNSRGSDERGIQGILIHKPSWTALCIATDYDTMVTLADAVETAIDSFSGTLGGVGGVPAKCRFLDSEDTPDPELNLYARSVSFLISY